MVKGKFSSNQRDVVHSAHEDDDPHVKPGFVRSPGGNDPRSPCHLGVSPKVPNGVFFFFFLEASTAR